jgi:hypothetical protein
LFDDYVTKERNDFTAPGDRLAMTSIDFLPGHERKEMD